MARKKPLRIVHRVGLGTTARGEFVELIPDQRVVSTWGWIDHPGLPPGSSTVEIDLVSMARGLC